MGGATEPGSVRGRPVTYSGDSLMDSGAAESAQGHPVTYSGGISTMGTDAGQSHKGQLKYYPLLLCQICALCMISEQNKMTSSEQSTVFKEKCPKKHRLISV